MQREEGSLVSTQRCPGGGEGRGGEGRGGEGEGRGGEGRGGEEEGEGRGGEGKGREGRGRGGGGRREGRESYAADKKNATRQYGEMYLPHSTISKWAMCV